MRRVVFPLVISMLVVSCATTQDRSPDFARPTPDLVSRAVQALGGSDALAGVRTLSMKGTVRQWEPEQSRVAGGEMRFAGASTFAAVTDTGRSVTRIDWVRKLAYPTPRTFTFSEIVTPEAGYVAGIDSDARTRQSLEAKPPAHAMSGLRLAAARRELRRASPLLLLELQKHPDRVSPVEPVTIGGVAHPAVDYRAGDQTFTVMFDDVTGLPARVRTLDYDSIQGDVTYDLVLSDWRTIDGLRIAASHTYELSGRPVAEVKIAEIRVNAPAPAAPARLAIPGAFRAGASPPAAGPVPYQWIIRRQFIGAYLDSDDPSYDARASSGLRFAQLARGVQHVVGGSHHSLLVAMRDHLIVFDAPVSDAHSNWVLLAAREKFPGKRVKYLVLTHHHADHAGGLRAYAAQGATIVVGQGNGAHFRRVLAAPFTRNPDLFARDLSRTPIIEVASRHVLTDGRRRVHAHRIENPHAAGLLIGYVADARLGFVSDLWSPGAGRLPARLDASLAALTAGVRRAGIWPRRFAGGHGAVADYAPLAALEDGKAATRRLKRSE
ncbi:MAG: MBL fold metallo-hydrolase [Candidatus Rokuibacteriota bacterium]